MELISGTMGLAASVEFTALRSCMKRHSPGLLALGMGRMGVLQGYEVGTNTPFSRRKLITGLMPLIASSGRWYCFIRGKTAFGISVTL